jgi:hypothetical protein
MPELAGMAGEILLAAGATEAPQTGGAGVSAAMELGGWIVNSGITNHNRIPACSVKEPAGQRPG